MASALLLAATAVTGGAIGPVADAKAEASKTPEIHTDTEPLAKRLPKLGRIVSAHWQQGAPGSDSRVPGPTDYYVSALMKLEPGSVAVLTASTQMQPAVIATEPESISIPAELAEFAPAGAQWVHSRVLDESLVRADSAKLYFDSASDTVYLSATNVHLPNAVTVHVGPDGNQVTITPTPSATTP
ncbi:hypothetical protein [Streptomyces sp. NBC_01320]|uniref:hypothetical protein n=1 Tax=Streptomyces sp. NBC_01320 TaxID=2903824 RepID=UPI002E0F2617|nr:hypothetical protein OG395_01520 [Streptomyces sp. NBC_01320]WSK00992.1 hypothetical protein OG395_53830 [Streptomyces sp. NBC_01320]